MTAEIWQDLEVDPGEMAQFSKVVEVQLRRPDRLRLRREHIRAEEEFLL